MSERKVNRPWIAAGCSSFSPCSLLSWARHSSSSTSKAPTSVRTTSSTTSASSRPRRTSPPARTYDQALTAGKISLQPVPQNQLTTGYQTTTTALKGKIASVPIFAGQQIIESQFGNTVAATSIHAGDPQGHDRDLGQPDRPRPSRRQHPERLRGRHLRDRSADGPAAARPAPPRGGDVQSTRLLLPKVTVLNVGSPQPPTTSTSTDESGTQTTESCRGPCSRSP